METNEMIAFCKERIPGRDWDNAELQIWSRENMLKLLSNVKKHYSVRKKVSMIIYAPDETSYQDAIALTAIHDGTELFVKKLIEDLIYRLGYDATWVTDTGGYLQEDGVKCFIGNLIVMNESGEFMPKCEECPDQMSNLHMRTTVMLPVKMGKKA